VSVHVSTCTACGADGTCEFLRLVAKQSDQFLEQRIKIKLCVKLGKTASNTHAVLLEAFQREALKKSRVSEWHKQFKENSNIEITSYENAHHFLLYRGHCSL
jgi:uncharacterized pyridoxamine 5'-phosphate oxidase family protein